jgi:hypothetical protein
MYKPKYNTRVHREALEADDVADLSILGCDPAGPKPQLVQR